ncbi:MAG: hypothetical protein WCA22_19335 [Candidatus Binatus sp.]
MGWNTKLSNVAKSGSTTAINALTAANCAGDVGKDAGFATHLSAAQNAAIAAVAGLGGAAANCDVSLVCNTDTGPGRAGIDAGAVITITVVERH